MELRIENETQQLPAITCNYDQIVAELKPKLERYKSLVYTEQDVAVAKQDKAMLNNLAKAINNKKIEVKNKQLEPYLQFETQIKSLLGMINEAVDAIDGQVKDFDEQRKSQKKEEIESYFNEASAHLNGVLAFEQIFDPKWLNVTVKMNAIKTSIDSIINRVQADLALIDDMHSEFETELKTTYLATLDIASVIRKKGHLETAKEQLLSYTQKTANMPKVSHETANNAEQQANLPTLEELITIAFKVVDVTAHQLASLKEFMRNNGIKYTKAD